MNPRQLFEDELQRRSIGFSIDPESGRHVLDIGDLRILISLDNLERDLARDGDTSRVAFFLDRVLESASVTRTEELSADGIYWALEPNDYEVPADYREPLSRKVDRVLVHVTSDGSRISWVNRGMLQRMGLGDAEARERGFANLARSLDEAAIEWSDVDGVRLGHLTTDLPFKASLLLAPNLRKVVEDEIGWPIMAVAPDRDFLYFWAADHASFAGRLGNVVVREYKGAAYPISTEVYEVSDDAFRAVGAFPVPD
jgi:hypothetical protein